MRREIPCKTCEAGQLKRRKRYRMSGIVVLIGYIILIPSLLGIAVATMGVVATGAATGKVADSLEREAQAKLRAAAVPPAIAQQVVSHRVVPQADLDQLTEPQRQAVEQVKLELTAGAAGAGAGAVLAGGASIVFGVFSLVGGLLGWLLVMKKAVLQCNACGAVVAAS
jgi:hypothetical protein